MIGRIATAIALAALLIGPAQAQFAGFAPPSAAPVPVFDLYPSPAPAAYCGTVRLRSAYAGHALRLQRSSDATQQDFDFTSKNVIDDAAVQTFIGSGFAWVATCYDQSGNGRDFPANLVATDSPFYKGASRAGFPAGANTTPDIPEWLGIPSIEFYARNTNAGSTAYLNISAGVSAGSQASSVMLASTVNDTRPTGVTQVQQCFVTIGTAGGSEFHFCNFQGATYAGDGSNNVFTTTPVASDWHVFGVTAGASNVCGYDDTTRTCASNTMAPATRSGGNWSNNLGAANLSYDGNSTAIIIWGSELTAAQWADRRDALKAQLGIGGVPNNLVVFDGDSITEDLDATFSEGHTARAIARIWKDTGKRVRAYNVAIGGRCLAASGGTCPATTLTSEFSSKTQGLVTGGNFLRRALYMMGGSNDLAIGTPPLPATLSGSLTTYISNARAAVSGVKLTFGGMVSRIGTGVDAACFTYMADAISASSYDALSGWYDDASMKCTSGGGTNYTNSTYFAGDGIHPINAGHDIGAINDATAIESLLQ